MALIKSLHLVNCNNTVPTTFNSLLNVAQIHHLIDSSSTNLILFTCDWKVNCNDALPLEVKF